MHKQARRRRHVGRGSADDQNLDLAEKIIRRAVAVQPDNPVLWNDQGMLLCQRNKEAEAEEAFRTAISLAPTYAEPFAHLAAMRARQGYLQDAVRLLEKAVQHAPQVANYVERLAAYRALVTRQSEPDQEPVVATPAVEPGAFTTTPAEAELQTRITELDWKSIAERLTLEGHVLIPAFVDASICAELRHMFDDDKLFAKTVVMDREDFGKGSYRYFRAPIPLVVDGLRRAVYRHVARIANEWQRLLNEEERFPDDWEHFRAQCRDAGQTTPTPILLRYGPGGFNALHRDLRGSVYFPIQMAVVLSARRESPTPDDDGFQGGEFLFCDVPEGKKARRRTIPAGLGDMLLFCTRDRLVRIGGAHGLQPVKHGVSPITNGTRLVLGVPFHEYR